MTGKKLFLKFDTALKKMHASKSRPFKVIDFQNYLRFWCLFLPHMKSTTTTTKKNQIEIGCDTTNRRYDTLRCDGMVV